MAFNSSFWVPKKRVLPSMVSSWRGPQPPVIRSLKRKLCQLAAWCQLWFYMGSSWKIRVPHSWMVSFVGNPIIISHAWFWLRPPHESHISLSWWSFRCSQVLSFTICSNGSFKKFHSNLLLSPNLTPGKCLAPIEEVRHGSGQGSDIHLAPGLQKQCSRCGFCWIS